MVSKMSVSTRHHRSFSFSLPFSLSWVLAAGAVVFATATGCSLLTKTDRERIDTGSGGGGAGTGGAGGAGGVGGTASTGATGGGGTGGTAPCLTECCSPGDCPETANECVQRTCTGGACGTKFVGEGVPVSTQTAKDCQLNVCDGSGGIVAVAQDTDTPDDAKACTIDKCQAGVPKNTNTPAGQACAEDGGKKCDGSGACVECVAPSDCVTKVCTVAGACAPAECGDGVKNGDETDTDCGGACGPTCATNETCAVDGDCIDEACGGSPKKCLPPSCSDGLHNGDETDTDCGGACGPTCIAGQSCDESGDCTGNICSGSFCLPSCTDGVKNNSETGLDCGGPTCVQTCDDGTHCDVASDCDSAFCVDAVCCNLACDGICLACSAAKKGNGSNGVCGAASPGTDPHDDCGVDAPESCGDATGTCNGFAACEKYAAGTPCDDAASCADGVQTNADGCDGSGACSDNGTTACGLFACGATACKTACAGDADCAETAFCSNMVCTLKKANAAVCAGGNQCASGSCADGLCCNAACSGPCSACSVAAGGVANGQCAFIAAGQDPASDCGSTGACDGAGACKKANGQTCLLGSECLSASCADGFCCNTPCAGLCQACSNLKKGSGANGSCAFVGVNKDPDEECPGVTMCSGGGTCSLIPIAGACALNGECQSGFCTDGLCCNAACGGFCQACTAAKTGGTNGTCADVTPGTDPDDECPDAATCDTGFTCMP